MFGQITNYRSDEHSNENVELFIVGEPKQMNNQASESEQLIQVFVTKLGQTFPKIPIKRVDERFTSKMAVQSMFDSGLKKNYSDAFYWYLRAANQGLLSSQYNLAIFRD